MVQRQKGFTLVELLVVIAIIGILSSVVLANLNTARQKARDVKRISDVKQLQLALALYFDAISRYPGALQSNLNPTFISVIPTDPTTGNAYTYTVLPSGCSGNACNDYLLQTTLELSNQVLDSDADTSNTSSRIYDVKP